MNQKFAMIFPGQGSQSLGMLAAAADEFPQVADTFSEASDALSRDLWALCQSGPAEALNETSNTQPCLLTASVALWRVWCDSTETRPVALAGHSLGEYSALVAGESIALADAVKLVAFRGQAMQSASPPGSGSMAAILGLTGEQVISACEAASDAGYVSAANFNAPGQVVIAGEKAAVAAAIEEAKSLGARRAMELAVSAPSHCQLMAPAAEQMASMLANVEISNPLIPVIHNADVASHQDAAEIKDLLVRQLTQPVRWSETIEHLAAKGVESVFECGPGKVLCGLNRRILKSMVATPLEQPDGLRSAITTIETVTS